MKKLVVAIGSHPHRQTFLWNNSVWNNLCRKNLYGAHNGLYRFAAFTPSISTMLISMFVCLFNLSVCLYMMPYLHGVQFVPFQTFTSVSSKVIDTLMMSTASVVGFAFIDIKTLCLISIGYKSWVTVALITEKKTKGSILVRTSVYRGSCNKRDMLYGKYLD